MSKTLGTAMLLWSAGWSLTQTESRAELGYSMGYNRGQPILAMSPGPVIL